MPSSQLDRFAQDRQEEGQGQLPRQRLYGVRVGDGHHQRPSPLTLHAGLGRPAGPRAQFHLLKRSEKSSCPHVPPPSCRRRPRRPGRRPLRRSRSWSAAAPTPKRLALPSSSARSTAGGRPTTTGRASRVAGRSRSTDTTPDRWRHPQTVTADAARSPTLSRTLRDQHERGGVLETERAGDQPLPGAGEHRRLPNACSALTLPVRPRATILAVGAKDIDGDPGRRHEPAHCGPVPAMRHDRRVTRTCRLGYIADATTGPARDAGDPQGRSASSRHRRPSGRVRTTTTTDRRTELRRAASASTNSVTAGGEDLAARPTRPT